MKVEMSTVALASLCRQVTDGTHASPKLLSSGFPFIKGKHISSGRIDFDGCDFISEADHLKVIERSKPERGDILFSNIGSVGDCAFVNDDREFSIKNVALFKPDLTKVDARYLYYLVNSPGVRGSLIAQRSGSAQPFIPLSALRQHAVRYHVRLSDQLRVVSILASYDDLIEVNHRRINLLQELSRRLFEEWFVYFRYPGHESDPIIETEEGPMPEGWRRETLTNMCSLIDYGYTASSQPSNVGPKFLRITDIVPAAIDWSTVPHCEIDEKRIDKYRLQQGDIVVARTGATVGYAKRLNKQHPTTVFASYLVRFRVKPEVSDLMIGIIVQSDAYKAYVKLNCGGSAQPNANAKVLGSLKLLAPPKHLQSLFQAKLEPIFDLIEVLQLQNIRLAASRDHLLPRLITGELRIPVVELELEAVA